MRAKILVLRLIIPACVLRVPTLLGDRLPEPLSAFLAGGGEALAERGGDREAAAAAGCL